MEYFAGLDVSLEETAICMIDETGRILKELRAAVSQRLSLRLCAKRV
jgi:predicted NBD/HSP70 family sugar kinase